LALCLFPRSLIDASSWFTDVGPLVAGPNGWSLLVDPLRGLLRFQNLNGGVAL